MKRAVNRLESKEVASNDNAVLAVLKPQTDNIPRPSSRYGQQSDLRDQNQLLMVTNNELQKNLTETKHRVTQLEQHNTELQEVNAEVQKQLKDCHMLLVVESIDPVLGVKIGETNQKNDDQRRDILNISRDLLDELRTFGDMATEQSALLGNIQKTMTDLRQARDHLMQERESFSLEADEMEKALVEAEELLCK
ncbi:small kinetochore-associated protein [Aplochiton taeniatus]